jgi:phage terminase large subunit-like protein
MGATLAELERFRRFAGGVGLRLEPFQLEVMEAVLSDRREVVVSQPRGAGKTTLLGCYAPCELVLHPDATIIAAATARDQAQHLYRAAARFAKEVPALRKRFTFTLREVRTPQDGRLIVVSADSERQMGHDPHLVIVDELGSHVRDDLYVSLRSALIKNSTAKIAHHLDDGRPRGGADADDAPPRAGGGRGVSRDGAVLRAETGDSLWLEWSVPEGADIDDMDTVKAANPRMAITTDMLAEHRRVLHEVAFRQVHCTELADRRRVHQPGARTPLELPDGGGSAKDMTSRGQSLGTRSASRD